jgi:large subunit ribosomal protein L23
MAIFSKKEHTGNKEAEAKAIPTDSRDSDQSVGTDVIATIKATTGRALVVPRLSEKAGLLNRLNKYVFKIEGKANKIELRKAIEKAYGVKIARINMVSVKGKYRRYGRTYGQTSAFKKAIVTLTPDSKKITIVEPS